MRHPQHRHHAMVACVCESLSPWDGVRRWMRAVGPGHEGSGQGGQGVLARRRRATRSCGERVRRLARAATAPPSEVRIVTARCKIHPTVIGPPLRIGDTLQGNNQHKKCCGLQPFYTGCVGWRGRVFATL